MIPGISTVLNPLTPSPAHLTSASFLPLIEHHNPKAALINILI